MVHDARAWAGMRRLRAGRGVIAQDFAFVEIKQQISCGITTIMGPDGDDARTNRTERARAARRGGGELPKLIALDLGVS